METLLCAQGHLLSGLEKFCPECGSRIESTGLVASFNDATNFGPTTSTPRSLPRSVYSYGRNHQIIASAVAPLAGSRLSTSQISDLVLAFDPSFQRGSLLVNDHAEGNAGACRCAGSDSRIFDRVERGLYDVRDLSIHEAPPSLNAQLLSQVLPTPSLSGRSFADWLLNEAPGDLHKRLPGFPIEVLTGQRGGRFVAVGIRLNNSGLAWAIGADRSFDFSMGALSPNPPYLGLRATSLALGSGPEGWQFHKLIKDLLPGHPWKAPDRFWPVWTELNTGGSGDEVMSESAFRDFVINSLVETFEKLLALGESASLHLAERTPMTRTLTTAPTLSPRPNTGPFNLEDLEAGIRVWNGRVVSSEWASDFHNSMYRKFDMLKEVEPFTEEWWLRFIMPRVGTWKAYRPVTKEQIIEWALPHLDEMAEAYSESALPYLDTPFENLEWSNISKLPDTVALAKRDNYGRPQSSPVFRSKVAHWIMPRLYPVADQEVLGISGSYESYWKATQEAWVAISQVEREAMAERLRTHIESAFHSQLWDRYPIEVKIVELCRMGRRL